MGIKAGVRLVLGWLVPAVWIVGALIEYLVIGEVDTTMEITEALWLGKTRDYCD